MTRKLVLAVAVLLFLSVGSTRAALGTTSLLVPQSTAFSVLGHSCGGIQEKAYANGFDAISGYPTGDVYLQTRCGGSGRGGGYRTTTYSAWLDVTWDYTGAIVSFNVLAAAPSVDPTFSAFDSFGNEVYNQLNLAYLTLAPTFVPPPRLTSVSVTSGPAAGGTSVALAGTGFTGATSVMFGTTAAASFVVNADASITAASPAENAGTVDITVTTAGGTSATSATDEFTFIAAPTVSGISPTSGLLAGGTDVAIAGTHFTDATGVDFGGTPAGFTVNDDSSITAVSPPAEEADTVHVTVTSEGGTSAPTAADRFTYVAPTCGNGILNSGEQCDDGNSFDGDGCSAMCRIETCFKCVGQPSSCSPLAAGTACNDGNACTVGETCDGFGFCGGFTSCRVNSTCSICGQVCAQPQPDVCTCQ